MIRVVDLTRRFGPAEALRGLSFEVPRGEIFGFVGPNGAGKTTTIRILATLLAPSSGTVTVDGVDVVREPDVVRAQLGYMPDFFGVYDQLTAGEYLAFYASCYRIPRRRCQRIVTDLLELIGLPEKRDVPVDTLSRGMKQRLCLARALVNDPALLLLDEPASGLDPRARVEMRELLRELRSMGKTIVVSSHILPELAEMCTSFGIIDHGRMVATGPLEALLSRGSRRSARVTVIGDAAEAALRAQRIEGVADVRPADAGFEVQYEGGDDAACELLAALVGGGIPVLSFTPTATDLEEIFMRVTADGASAEGHGAPGQLIGGDGGRAA